MTDNNFFNSIEPLPLKKLAKIANCEIQNTSNDILLIKGVAPIDTAQNDDITFLSNKKYSDSLAQSKAAACILSADSIDKAPENMALLISDNPYAAYAKIAQSFYPTNNGNNEISPAAFIAPDAQIADGCTIEAGAFIASGAKLGKNCYIASGAYINKNVQIGDNCNIGHAVTLSHAIIGNNVILHPGVKVGQDGFGFATEHGVHIKVPQLGRVIIEDDVEIGANSCIDRGAGPDTIIGAGTKIDNLVQIGHNAKLGKGCIIVSHVGISGSTKLGNYVVLGGQVGVAGHLNIGDMVNVAAQSGVIHNIEAGQTIGGSPAIPVIQWHRQNVAIKKLVQRKDKK